MVVATWNLQGASLRNNNQERMRRACQLMKERKWDITILYEIRSEAPRTLWLGDGKDRMALVHSRKTRVVLSGSALEGWTRNGQRVEHRERTTAVVTEGARFVAIYQPLWSEGD